MRLDHDDPPMPGTSLKAHPSELRPRLPPCIEIGKSRSCVLGIFVDTLGVSVSIPDATAVTSTVSVTRADLQGDIDSEDLALRKLDIAALRLLETGSHKLEFVGPHR